MVLLSPKFLFFMKRGITHGAKYYFHPFVWNKSRNEPELTKSRRRLFLWYLNVLITAVYFVFVLYQSVQVNLDRGASKGKKIYMRFIVIFQALPLVFQTTIFLKKEEFCRFFIMTRSFFQQLDVHGSTWISHVAEPESGPYLNSNLSGITRKQQQQPGQEKEQDGARERTTEFKMPKIFGLFFDFVWYIFIFASFGMAVVSTLQPKAADKISSVLLHQGQPLALQIPLLGFCVLFQVYYNVMYSGNASLFTFTAFCLFFPALVVLKEIKNQLSLATRKSQRASGFLNKENVKIVLNVYTSMEIVMKQFHVVYCTSFLPATKIILISLSVLCTYGAIKMSGFVVMFLVTIGIISITYLIAVFGTMAWAHTYSEEILFLMKSPQFQRHLDLTGKRYVESLTLLKFKMGSSYYVDKECVITVLQIVVHSTVDLLLANSHALNVNN